MKKTLLTLLACICMLGAWADLPFRNHRYDSFKVMAPAEGSILFLGNSITDMHCWPEVFKTSSGEYLPIVNRGNSGTISIEQSDNLETYLVNKPKKIFMMIGTNDIGSNITPEQVLANVNSMVTRIHLRYPDVKVYIYSILNNSTGNRRPEDWLKANELFKAYASEKENVTYVDLYDKLINVATDSKWSYDHLHLTAGAYRVWCEAICQYLQEGEEYTVSTVYPENSIDVQQNGGASGSNGMRGTYFSMMPIGTGDVLVFGDEMVKNGEWHELLGNVNVKNRGTGWGYGGDIATTTAMVKATYAETGVRKDDAKAIFLYTGTAECNGTTDMETVKANYKALVDLIAEKSPSSVLYLMSLCPINNATTNAERISVLNEYARTLADGNDKIGYVDIYNALVNNGVANTRYFYPSNYLGGLGYVKVAHLMKEALLADFPEDIYNVITEEDAQLLHDNIGIRNALSQAMSQMLSLDYGTCVGQYGADAKEQVDAKLKEASAVLSGSEPVTQAQVDAFVAATKGILSTALIYPSVSTDGDEHWYQISSLRSNAMFFTAEGTEAGVLGSADEAIYACSMWKFVNRGDDTYDVINRGFGSYLSPAADFNTQIQTVQAQPEAGWSLSYGDNTGYFILSSGEVQVNQTGSAQNFKIYNWSNPGSKGTDRADAGCQLKIQEAPEPEERPEDPETVIYTVDKANGNLYRGESMNQSFNSVWKSTAVPQLQFGCGTVNNINWSGENIQLFSGSSGNATYTLAPPDGYVIEEYAFTFVNGGHSNAITITMDNGNVYTTGTEEQTVSATAQKLRTLSFTQVGSNTGVIFKDFTVKVKKDNSSTVGPEISTEGNVHWYYIANASTKDYCRDKVMYYDGETRQMRFGDKAFRAEYIWSFWEQDGKIAIKNYRGEYFGTPGAGTGGGTSFGIVSEPNYIYSIQSSFGAFIIKDSGVELHAQNAGAVIVRWAAEADGASLWRFDEADVSNAEASVAGTLVEQGKVTTGIGNKDQGIIRSTIRVTGLDGVCHLKSIQGMFVGKDPKDISNVKIYLASNSNELYVDRENKMPWREQNGELLAGGSVDENRRFDIDVDKDLVPGEHYLWIAYDIAETAKEGNYVDARIFSYVIDADTLKETSKTGHPANSATIFLSESAALMPWDMGTKCYRIPSITVTKDGSRLVAISDDRKGHGADLPSHCYLVAQYSDDLGKTWSQPVTVAGTADLGGDYGHGDASIVTNRDNGDIIGIMTSAGIYGHGFFAGTAQEPPRWKTIVSHDNGETWEAPVDHTDDLFGANCDNPDTKTWKSGFSGSGAALQKRDGTLVSSFVNRQADNSQHFYFFMSKDGGKNWYVSGTSGTSGADEPKTLERNNGDLAISVRHGGYNYHNVTSDDGATWKYPSQTQFTTGISGNACDGEYMVWCSTVEGNPWDISFQTLPNSSSRENVSIALSTDEGETFGKPKTICPRGSAYSAAVVLPDGTLGIYYEENSLSTGGYTMRFVRCSLDWASDGLYKFTEDNPFHPIKSTVTGISDVLDGSTIKTDNAIYDLQGRRVVAPAKAGVYIQNGKKVLMGK
ncbi:MAG: GDSL-type esterase/lipase family protein [Bacteroides sp.]|nr:GDSL-type esterase/lipase family protein [Bacteroides sp.]MCM1447958.1 GDSL-type esterase/lipase family protein [Bacteroides sp.]